MKEKTPPLAKLQPPKTLRDEFAMAAIIGFCAMPQDTDWGPDVFKEMASQAYELADAMLRARGE